MSKSQWQQIGITGGWLKTAQQGASVKSDTIKVPPRAAYPAVPGWKYPPSPAELAAIRVQSERAADAAARSAKIDALEGGASSQEAHDADYKEQRTAAANAVYTAAMNAYNDVAGKSARDEGRLIYSHDRAIRYALAAATRLADAYEEKAEEDDDATSGSPYYSYNPAIYDLAHKTAYAYAYTVADAAYVDAKNKGASRSDARIAAAEAAERLAEDPAFHKMIRMKLYGSDGIPSREGDRLHPGKAQEADDIARRAAKDEASRRRLGAAKESTNAAAEAAAKATAPTPPKR